MKPGPKPRPAARRNYRATISLGGELAAVFWAEGERKSEVAADALRLWYSLSAHQRESMLTAALFNWRGIGVQ